MRNRNVHPAALAALGTSLDTSLLTSLMTSLGTALLLGAWSGRAQATMAPPVIVELVGNTQPAEGGMSYASTFRLTARAPMVLELFALEPGAGWAPISLTAPAVAVLDSAQTLDIPFAAQAFDPAVPLVLTFTRDGHPLRFPFDLSPQHDSEAHTDQPTRIVAPTSEGEELRVPSNPPLPSPEPDVAGSPVGVGEPPPGRGAGSDGAATAKGARTIHVVGKIVFNRGDRDSVGVDGATVRIYDGNTLWGQTTTDAFGFFSFTFNWSPCFFCFPLDNPNLYIRYYSSNASVVVSNGNALLLPMVWKGPVYQNFTGTFLDMGLIGAKVWNQNQYLFILSTITRAWRWLNQNTGISALQVNVTYPENVGVPYYSFWEKRIRVNVDRVWQEVLLIHEYGHHIVSHYANGKGTDYCNGICDDDGCGHCTWCAETGFDAWNEGFPTWMGDTVSRGFKSTYGIPRKTDFETEQLQLCGVDNTLHDPLLNEGTFVAALRDIEDSDPDDDPLTPAGYDALNLGSDEILAVTFQDLPNTPLKFFTKFANRYPFLKENLWQTARNNGYDLDTQKPGIATSVISTDHTVGVTSPDGTISLAWTTAPDDMSGIDGYAVTLTQGGPVLPGEVMTLPNVSDYTSIQLPSGTWWFNLRAVDRSGRWSDNEATLGPLVIALPAPADLAPIAPDQWAYSLVPEPNGVFSSGYIPVPSVLNGNGPSTWWNLAVTNHGATGTPFNMTLACAAYLDGAWLDYAVLSSGAPLLPGQVQRFNNYGPQTVRGGRHTLSTRLDALEQIAEGNEVDNRWGHQWVWSPLSMPVGSPVQRAAPPPRIGGWSDVPSGPLYVNSDGLRSSIPFGFYGVYVQPLSTTEDFDIYLYQASTDVQTGFDVPMAGSAKIGGYLDAVLLFRPLLNPADYDVGIINYSGDAPPYRAGFVAGSTLPFATTQVIALGQNEMLLLRSIVLSAPQLGQVSASLQVTPATSRAHLLWFDQGFTLGGLTSANHAVDTNAAGKARVNFTVSQVGQYYVAVYRDPKDGTGPISVSLRVEPTPPDYVTFAAPGWFAPLVPRTTPDGAPGSVPAPVALYGDVAPTYLNLSALNVSPAEGVDPGANVLLDGTLLTSLSLGTLRGGQPALINSTSPFMISAGRHALSVALDPAGATAELDDANNVYGTQWVWLAPNLSQGVPVTRTLPPSPISWVPQTTPPPDGLWYDCDGLRMSPQVDGRTRQNMWAAVAAMPGAGSDVDLQLHPAATSAAAGYAEPLALSGWSPGLSDFVVVNFNRTSPRTYDVGAVNSSGTSPYTAVMAGSSYLATNPNGLYGNITLPAVQMLALREVWLDPGFYVVQLHNVSGQVDWGLALHPGNLAYLSKSSVVDGAIAWLNGPGQDEWVTVRIDQGRFYCVSIWKNGAADLPLSGVCRLEFTSGFTSAPPVAAAPLVTALAGAHPNPFNPRTTIVFTLEQPQEARLEVYSLRGERVRELASGPWPAGRHEVLWDGLNARGRQVASGVYVVRMATSGRVRDEVRVTLLK